MEQDLVIPTYQSQASEENYEGATVIDPVKGVFRLGFVLSVNGFYCKSRCCESATSVNVLILFLTCNEEL
jgi:hypothetical protein